ncbi:MAG: rod shape-determining protein [Muribaculaceae bacterium]|nr:rod shape-determining protein [Muribaculaceae bacterium]
MDTRYIIAIEIGSSKVKGIAASVGELGDINVVAIEEARLDDCTRYGKIQNVQEVSAHVNDIIRKIENNPRIAPRKVSDIFISVGGRSLSTARAQAQRSFPVPTDITSETIKRLESDASFGLVTDKTNLAMLPYAFYIDNSEVKKVVGTVGKSVRAVFTAIVISPSIVDNLKRLKIDGRNIHFIIRPTALADLVLTSSEKQVGCALVDFGSETTTVTIYKDQVLQQIITLPIGSRNITRDLMIGLSMTEESADAAKMRSGVSLPGDEKLATDIEINNYISARAGEIIANIMHQIELAGFKPQTLKGGIILTGGGSRLVNFDRLVESQTKMPVRVAAIDSSLQFKGNNLDRNGNIDILAIAKNATEKFDIDCLTPRPVEVIEQQIEQEKPAVSPLQDQGYIRRPPIDDESLLEDDEDDDAPARTNTIRVKNKKSRDFDDEDFDDEGNTGENTKSTIKNLIDRMARFWNDSHEDDDIDETVN